MPRLLIVGLLILVAIALVGCRVPAGAPAATIATPSHWSGAHSGVTTPAMRVVRSAEAWAALWRDLGGEPPRELGPGEMAIAVFAGERPTAGYRLEVASAAEAGDEFVVTYREHTPAPDRMVAQVLTSPWVVAIVPNSPLPVSIRPRSGEAGVRSGGRP